MAKRDWALIHELTSALGRSNAPRTLPKAIGKALREGWRALGVRLVLVDERERHTFDASFKSNRWTSTQKSSPARRRTGARRPSATRDDRGGQLVLPVTVGRAAGELRCRFGRGGHPILEDPTYLSTLARVVEVGIEYQQLVGRVADLSRHAYSENRVLRESLESRSAPELVARSAAMRAVVERLGLVARYDTPVLVRGESGVGKELVSREIHRRSPRSRRAFIQVNCGAIPQQLVESELFGHEKGAFTGAERRHRGVFEQASGGVLFLDEVGELPLATQVKLLRVLQEGRLRRVGAESEIEVDVRVVAATNRDLETMVAEGSFREDLFYRLNVFPIAVAPLRERLEDIAPLVRALVERLAAKLGIPRPPISEKVLSRFRSYAWPGNVRQLANVLEAALIVGGGRSLAIPSDFRAPEAHASDSAAAVVPLDAAIRAAIENALRLTRGKIYGADGAGAVLGLHPATLQAKMRKLGIERVNFVRANDAGA